MNDDRKEKASRLFECQPFFQTAGDAVVVQWEVEILQDVNRLEVAEVFEHLLEQPPVEELSRV